jgi:hypothetical protein
MNIDRRMRLWSLVADNAQGAPARVEHVAAAVMLCAGVDGVAVTVVLAATPRETIYTSDRVASQLEELTLTLGEGPGVDAINGGPALVADLAAPQCLTRWPAFAPAAVAGGARAMFALPLQIGAIHLGVISLYRAEPGDLDPGHLADVLVLADTALALLLDAADGSRRDGHQPAPAGLQHPEVHQATGMIIVQLGVSAAVALVRLRAYAYANDRLLRDVAADVIARRLRFHPDGGDHGGTG